MFDVILRRWWQNQREQQGINERRGISEENVRKFEN
jgi:hypothetical protein